MSSVKTGLGAHLTDPGCAHSAPRPRAHCAVSWRAGCRIAGPAPTVSQAPLAISWPCRWADRVVASMVVSWCTWRRVVACLATHPATKPPSCHDTIVFIVTHLANQTARLSRYKDCIVTQPPAARPSLLSRYKTLYRDTHPQRPGPRARTVCPCGRVGHVVAQLVISWHATTPPCASSRPCHASWRAQAMLVTIQHRVS